MVAKLYDRKTPLTSADLLNDRVVPFFDSHDLAISRVLTDRGTEYCGRPESHDYELFLAIENIDHTRTKVKSPRTTDVIDKRFFRRVPIYFAGAWSTARRRAGFEVKVPSRSLHRRSSF